MNSCNRLGKNILQIVHNRPNNRLEMIISPVNHSAL